MLMPPCLNKSDPFYKTFRLKYILRRLKQDVRTYITKFSSVLRVHSENEFEVTIKCNSITNSGHLILDKLKNDFAILQYEDQISSLVHKYRIQMRGYRSISRELLDVVEDDIVVCFQEYLEAFQSNVLQQRRKKNNNLCN